MYKFDDGPKVMDVGIKEKKFSHVKGLSQNSKVHNEGKSGFVSHTKLIAEATFMDLFHSRLITCTM